MKDYVQKLINLFASSEQNAKNTADVQRWLADDEHRAEKDEALRTLWQETEAKADDGIWSSLATIYNKVGYGTMSPSVRRFKWWHIAAAAVVLVAITSASTFFLSSANRSAEVAMVENATSKGEMRNLILPDGSMVQANSSTVLLYPETFDGKTRTVFLIGEANFKVKKNPDQPFIVRSTTFSVTALGTEFDVQAYPDSKTITATLIHGKVKVSCTDKGRNYILMPGQQIIYDKEAGKEKLYNVDLEDVTAWQQGVLVFRGTRTQEVLNTIERRYGVSFVYNQKLFNNDKFNFRFREKSSLTEILDVMKVVVGGFKYHIKGDICYLKSSK